MEVDNDEPFVASIQEAPGNKLLVFRDSGSTPHATGYVSIFIDFQKVNLTLTIASAKQHLVFRKGKISLVCQAHLVNRNLPRHFTIQRSREQSFLAENS
ncbi:hypothetical protein O181_003013 [Austropuccinia psidii MF-1]|uniref:Uncharacterized protein n=1 Tax=Austropuccinia psidii MF-1 TaxID=1389203 RepID=A0A9Q3GD59_9BASI|nr:hypothetical protein [Austropuccinia psidii MF-1]